MAKWGKLYTCCQHCDPDNGYHFGRTSLCPFCITDPSARRSEVTKVRLIQAKDVNGERLLDLVKNGGRYVFFSQVAEAYNPVPPKVIRAKVRKLIKQGKLDGCWCGCNSILTYIEQPVCQDFAKISEKGWYKYSENGPIRVLN